MYTYNDFALLYYFLSTALYRRTRHESSSSPSSRDETLAEGEFAQDKKGTFGGKAKFTLKSVTGSQDPANTTGLVFPNRGVPPGNCFSNTTKSIELGVQGSRRRRVKKGKPAEFQIFGVYL